MNVLIDTNVLGRMAEPAHPQHRLAITSTDRLDQQGDQLCIVPQVLYEFWVVATRPTADNGLGLSIPETTAELARMKTLFLFLSDSAAIYPEWERLVTGNQVSGKSAHDARLVAAMAVHGLTHLLTFNTGHFARYHGIMVLDPVTLAVPPSP
jgi:predicted nucleic acid-binding protein